jgi:hypothetical protein
MKTEKPVPAEVRPFLKRAVKLGNYMRVQGAYRNVFTLRFADNHGLEAGPVLVELDKLTLSNAGPELIVPPR